MTQKIIIKQSTTSFVVRTLLLLLPMALLEFVGLSGGLDKWGIILAVGFGLGSMFAIIWFNSKSISIDGGFLTFSMLFKKKRSVELQKITSIDRLFKWMPAGKTIAPDSTLKISIREEDPLIIPIEDLEEKDIQLLVARIREIMPDIELNKLAQRTLERKVTTYKLLTSNYKSILVAIVVVIFLAVIIGLIRKSF
jgi:hypothetical protein